MKCQFCANPATIHMTDILDKKERETHLCEGCARQKKILPDQTLELQIPAILQFLLGSPASKSPRADREEAACPHCGMRYAQFRSEGRLGCPEDYDLFKAQLEPLLLKIHRAVKHAGKVPAHRLAGQRNLILEGLRGRLQAAVANENYEEAALLRDSIRSEERRDETR